ncbi:MAG: VIT and VWA domain-containing protein [Hyphomicrobium sp.]|nr:VIT and VWA domain-containing protein [Hyphomicrobium sp.]
MPHAESRQERSPVSQAVSKATALRAAVPIPLVSTSYDISIIGGLAAVTAVRTFHNIEAHSIEATLTFPVPIHAVLYDLEARIGDRVLKAVTQAKAMARQAYEDALDTGKTAVLYEELLKGIHMLSVGHIAPGQEISVTFRFAMALAQIDGRTLLNIPLTVGQVYGSSGLPDSDDLLADGPEATADVTVRAENGTPKLLGGTLEQGHGQISLGAPLIVEVEGWAGRTLIGQTREGATVALSIAPAPASKRTLSAAVLVDHSGSMSGHCGMDAHSSKHAAAVQGLRSVAEDLAAGDRLHLFEFDDDVREVGAAGPTDWNHLLGELSGPAGGTEIGRALEAVIASTPSADVILVTDGLSHALDVQALAKSGRRFTVVLIGADSLEANVGHLAALSGGQIFAPGGTGIAGAVRSALRAARLPQREPSNESTTLIEARSGMKIRATWNAGSAVSADAEELRAVAAYATGLRLASLSAEEASQIAEAEGLVTHLTSFILVDENGVKQEGLAATRKVMLAVPVVATVRAASSHGVKRTLAGAMYPPAARMYLREETRGRYSRSLPRYAEPDDDGYAKTVPSRIRLGPLAERIDWSRNPRRLAAGDVTILDEMDAVLVLQAASSPLVAAAASAAGIGAEALVIGLLARARAPFDRNAARLARTLLKQVPPETVAGLMAELMLADPQALAG